MRPLLFSTVLLAAHIACAAIFTLRPGESIQIAANAAAEGDTIVLTDGEYVETVVIQRRSLVIASSFLFDGDTCHISTTTWRPDFVHQDSGSCLIINDCTGGVSVVGLSLRNGTGTLDRFGQLRGGGIAIFSSNIEVRNCEFAFNNSELGGGLCADGLPADSNLQCRIQSSHFHFCSSEAFGGGLYGRYVQIVVDNCRFSNNSCSIGGSGLLLQNLNLFMDSCRVDSNGPGSGALSIGDCIIDISHTFFAGNSTGMQSGVCDLEMVRTHGLVTGCSFSGNLSPTHSIDVQDVVQTTPLFESNIFSNSGGTVTSGMMLLSRCRVTLIRNLFVDNLTGGGGLLSVIGSENMRNTLRHNLFINNRVLRPVYGSVLFDQTFEGTVMDSNWFEGNAAPVATTDGGTHRQFNCLNNWWGHPSGPYHAELNPTGQGDTLIGDDCDFIPWLTEPPDTSGWLPAISHERIPLAKSWQIAAIYPNPFNSSVTIELNGLTGSDFELSLHNLLGQKVDTIRQGFTRGETIHYSAPPNMSSGVYFLVARDRSTMDTKKLVLLR